MEKLTCILVDDELHARRLLRKYIESDGSFELLGEFANADSALEALPRLQPQVLFLDVQMPGKSGIELLAALDEPDAFLVVFTTAYDQYALHAFEASAVDYLLKPFDEERFAQAAARLRRMHAGRTDAPVQRLLEQYPAAKPSGPLERITCRSGPRLRIINVKDIYYIEAAGNYCKAVTAEGAHLLGCSISEVQKKLDPARFVRIHRSTIVHTEYIAGIEAHFNGEYKLELRNRAALKVSRSYKEEFNHAMGLL
ncbi:LytTR family DNA-binding domain-containing protein [Flaviaesturariibacter amylovorans]|uniref:LytTR family DNA-binding domain-containing protein n=1 Tax=Flaviaesturariibacter amylovorans TaxID=1084520 RepID=A0ABP8HHB6_9BACT